MTIEVFREEKTLRYKLGGRLTSDTAPELEKRLFPISTGIEKLIFDFDELQYMSSAGLRVLFQAQRQANASGFRLVLRNVPDTILDVLELTGGLDFLQVENGEVDENEPIFFEIYPELSDVPFFEEVLLRRFREKGYTREIVFHPWNCYNDAPLENRDMYMYDSLVLSSLCRAGIIQVIPPEVSTEGIYPWILDSTLYRQRRFALPCLACTTLLFHRKDEPCSAKSIYDLDGRVAAPTRSMINSYYMYALCDIANRAEDETEDRFFSRSAMELIKQLVRLMGGKKAYRLSRWSTYDGVREFDEGEAKYMLAFSEIMRFLDSDKYDLQPISFSGNAEKQPLFPIDLLSIGSHLSGEKYKECVEILKIVGSPDFWLEISLMNGKLQYVLPVYDSIYAALAEKDPLYNKLHTIVDNDENKASRFGGDYYEFALHIEKALMQAIETCDEGELILK